MDRFKGACPCCGRGELRIEVREALVALEGRLGVELRLNSGFRCKFHNSSPSVGGKPDSLHLQGRAADVRADGWTPQELAAAAEEIALFAEGGIGMYPDRGFVHVDNGERRRWVV